MSAARQGARAVASPFTLRPTCINVPDLGNERINCKQSKSRFLIWRYDLLGAVNSESLC